MVVLHRLQNINSLFGNRAITDRIIIGNIISIINLITGYVYVSKQKI